MRASTVGCRVLDYSTLVSTYGVVPSIHLSGMDGRPRLWKVWMESLVDVVHSLIHTHARHRWHAQAVKDR